MVNPPERFRLKYPDGIAMGDAPQQLFLDQVPIELHPGTVDFRCLCLGTAAVPTGAQDAERFLRKVALFNHTLRV